MRVALATTVFALGLASPAAGAMGDWATASATASSVSLRLHYPMTCNQPGRGPLVVRLPASARVGSLRVLVRGVAMAASASGSTVTVDLPKPPAVTCMSITEGVLPVTLRGVRVPAGASVVTASIGRHHFSARLTRS